MKIPSTTSCSINRYTLTLAVNLIPSIFTVAFKITNMTIQIALGTAGRRLRNAMALTT